LASKAGTYDQILMDIRMPKLNGLEAARKIRKLNRTDAKTIPIIAMTANAFDEDVQESKEAGMNAHLSKPINPQLLYETIEMYAGKKL
jgi:CheY-like chemotaxis protein